MHDSYRGLNRIRDPGGNPATTRVGWAQYTVNPFTPLTLIMGTRLDDHSTFGTAVSPNIAATVRASDRCPRTPRSVGVPNDNFTNSQDPNTGHLSGTGTALPLYRPEIGRTFRGGLRWNWNN